MVSFGQVFSPAVLVTATLALQLSSSLKFWESGSNYNCSSLCELPDCLCMSTEPPKNMSSNEIPQLVFLTFDDAITPLNYENYTAITRNRVNPNGCPISMTFYINHEYNDYTLAHDLFYAGHELASHTVTHKAEQEYWSQASEDLVEREVGQMAYMISKYAQIFPIEAIKGFRAPSLQTSGSRTYAALSKMGLYDHSMPTQKFLNPPIWPYTLDYGSAQDCSIPPCVNVTDSFPGAWVVPIIDLVDKNGDVCVMADACARPNNALETLNLLRDNFQRHYNSSKAPFGIHSHAAFFQGTPYIFTGYIQFLNYLATLEDVYIVSVSQGLEWMKNPGTISQAASLFDCPRLEPSPCERLSCSYTEPAGLQGERVMKSCVPCPPAYPWLDNPDGLL